MALHLHLYSPNEGVLRDVELLRKRLPGLKIGISLERVDLPPAEAPVYYSTARFVRAHQLLAHYRSPLCLVDTDALFNRPWKEFVSQFDPQAEVVLACPDPAPFWEQVMAGVVFCQPTAVATHFLARVSQFILGNLEMKSAIWFTDQIALAACADRFAKEDRAVSHVPAELLMDVHHHAQAPLWAITTKKKGMRAYDLARERLGQRYGHLPSGSRDDVLAYVGRAQAPVFFLQIGAMDGASFDPIHQHVKAQGWHGLLVEPLPDMLARARTAYGQQPGLTFENAAITEQDEARQMFRVPVAAAQQAGLPYWVAGMSTFVPGKLDEYKPHVVEQTVNCMRLGRLLAKHRPKKIDVLQIDAEGYDLKILKQFDFSTYRPAVVNFECVNLNTQERMEAESLLFDNGYLFYQVDQDLFAVRRDIFFVLPNEGRP